MQIISKSEIERSIDITKIAPALRAAFISMSRGDAQVPPVGYLGFPANNGDCHIKFGHIKGDPVFVVKIATGFYSNPSKGLPTGNGVVLALSAETGEVLAILQDEGLLTDLRTGFGGAIATEALARKDARKIAIVGTGVQARHQIRAHREVLSKRNPVFTVWGRTPENARRLADELKGEGITVDVSTELAELCSESDVIVTSTMSQSPIVMADWIRPGTHITATGADAPGKQELDTAVVKMATVRIADHVAQCLHHGEFSHSGLLGTDVTELGIILDGGVGGRTNDLEISVVDLTGVAVQDIAIAQTVLNSKSGNFNQQ
ncbi:MAG TPA: ornithine cyclodeaminase family protein [Pararhizobium sp.]|uniref:ornithine cyclodeaminase family protein n=1 Tax=Pararhizobium sp. TaxID=1977563 RepID=UPI002BDED8E5|nr:ornithine cyclodeaminase family protein [Pararhizobium sp.]HTO31524.1 ornithine cyclodeaminase family protein [Pararhizobium sp.]